jgi:hypothetical protein
MAEYDWTADPVVQPGGQISPAPAPPGYDFQADPVVSPPGNRPPGAINAAGDTIDPVTGRLRIRVTPRNQPDPNLLPKVEGEDYQPAGPLQEPIGAIPAAAVGAVQGASLNFGDETAGALAAAGQPVHAGMLTIPATALKGVSRLGYEALTSKGEATAAFEAARDRWRATVERAQTLRPYSYGGGQVAGSLALPIGVAAAPVRAAPAVGGVIREGLRRLGTRMVRGGITGAGVGGVSGLGEGTDLTSRAEHGATGTVLGGAVGAGVPVATTAIGAVAQPVTRAISSRVRAVFRPTQEAERRVFAAKEADTATDQMARNRLTDAETAAARTEGEPVMLLDTGGEEMRGLARSAANQSPQGRAVLTQEIVQRSQEAPVRIADRLIGMFTYTPQARDRVVREVAENVYEPRYAKAWKDAANTPLWPANQLPGPRSSWKGLPKQSPTNEGLLGDLSDIAQAEEVQKAIRIANPQLRNWAAADGLPMPKPAFKIVDGKTVLSENKNSVNIPSLQYWDYIKRALDKMGTPTSRMFAHTIRNNLDEIVPSYKTAREAASHIKFFEGAPNAYEAGRAFVAKGQQIGPEARAKIAAMDPREQNLFRDGYLQEVVERIDKNGRLDTITRIQRSRAAREEMEAALGKQGFAKVEVMVRLHDMMERANAAVRGNSTTARQIIEYGLASGAGGYGAFTGDPNAIAAAALVAGRRAVNERLSRRIAELLVRNDPDSFQKATQYVMRDQRTLDRLRALGDQLGSKGAPPQTTNVAGPQAGGYARPEEKSVPGPEQQ